MRLVATLATAALLLGTGYATARSANTMTSGRPSAVLSEAQCQKVWKRAVPDGDTLAKANASPFVVNFSQIDKNGDGTISSSEFKAGCGKGLIKYTEHNRRKPDRG